MVTWSRVETVKSGCVGEFNILAIPPLSVAAILKAARTSLTGQTLEDSTRKKGDSENPRWRFLTHPNSPLTRSYRSRPFTTGPRSQVRPTVSVRSQCGIGSDFWDWKEKTNFYFRNFWKRKFTCSWNVSIKNQIIIN